MSILRYLGRTYGYYPSNDLDTEYRIESTLDALEDYVKLYFKYYIEPKSSPMKEVYKKIW